jgi:hypothetical protein
MIEDKYYIKLGNYNPDPKFKPSSYKIDINKKYNLNSLKFTDIKIYNINHKNKEKYMVYKKESEESWRIQWKNEDNENYEINNNMDYFTENEEDENEDENED